MERLANWLELRWVTPAYSGWVLGGLTLFFLGAATNSMAGWLYVMSGVSLALLAIAAILPTRSLRSIQVIRFPIQPVSAGEPLAIELVLKNQTGQTKTLVQVQDLLPYVLGPPVKTSVESIPARSLYRWVYQQPTQRRGVYHWHNLQLRSAAPLGLFWCRRFRSAEATAIVYPPVLPLLQCPLLDEIGREASPQFYARDRRSEAASEGITRSLRPYRWGDPTRMVHWRTSARYGELRVRELEVFTGGDELIVCLDSGSDWESECFEQAAIAAASLYFYACRQQQPIRLWTAKTGLLWGERPVLEALAATHAGEDGSNGITLPNRPIIWLSQNPASLDTLPSGSRWLLWSDQSFPNDRSASDRPTQSTPALASSYPGLKIDPAQPLQQQLQRPLR